MLTQKLAVELLESLNGKFPCFWYKYPNKPQNNTTMMFLAVEISQIMDKIIRCPLVFSFISGGPI